MGVRFFYMKLLEGVLLFAVFDFLGFEQEQFDRSA